MTHAPNPGHDRVHGGGLAAVVALSVTLAFAACSDSDSDSDASSTTTTPQAALCDAKDGFASSLDAVKDIDVVKDGTSALQAAFDDLKASGQAFGQAARANYSDDVDALEESISALGTSLQQARADGLEQVRTAADEVKTSAATLVDEVESRDCS